MTYWNRSAAFRRSKRASAVWWGRAPCGQRLSAARTFLGQDLRKMKKKFIALCSAICYRAKIRCEVPIAYLSRALRSWDDPFVRLPWFSEVLQQENVRSVQKKPIMTVVKSTQSAFCLGKCIRNTLLLSNIKVEAGLSLQRKLTFDLINA